MDDMVGMGTMINTAAIIAGGLSGMLFGRFLKEGHQDTLCKTCGICVLFIAMGAFIGEMLNIEGWFEIGLPQSHWL